ncbi:Cj0069 family protein [Bradyrhizobium canariense]|uniref:DUF6815 domain-containing protein n=1 Tax=Bradyrhizobium canariense TaxID=255045 RepID=A0A1H1WX22_9BRAD|nr:Cj0069 family protein [Bradyrhizobium canariense]SDT01290.1 hypothetical protein SAMN05444158_4040 [Bradyrhizobium canariense]
MTTSEAGKLALLWPRDAPKWHATELQDYRLHAVFEAMAARGIEAEPAFYADDAAEQVREQLLCCDGVLVWVDPLSQGRDRVVLDALLRDVASNGVWVSTHPDVILKMGVKEVLHRTKSLGWGTDTHLYRDVEAFREEFPQRLQAAGPRVLKQNRGNGGEGVWKIELASETARDGTTVQVLHASRGSVPQEMPLGDFMSRCEPYFANEGCIVDQPFQARLPDGMIRCYMGADKVVGFGHQLIRALIPPPPEGPDSEAARPGPRIMHPASAPTFQALRTKMESEWTPQMMQLLDIDVGSLPIIWDADFLYGPRDARGQDTYVLCEINVSSVFPFPEHAPSEIARLAKARSGTCTHKVRERER